MRRGRLGGLRDVDDGGEHVPQLFERDDAGRRHVVRAGIDRDVVDGREVGLERPLPQLEHVVSLGLDDLDLAAAEGAQGVVQGAPLHGDGALPLAARREQAQLEERLRAPEPRRADAEDRGAVTRDLDLAEAAVLGLADGLRRQQRAGQLLPLDGEVNLTGAPRHGGEVGEERRRRPPRVCGGLLEHGPHVAAVLEGGGQLVEVGGLQLGGQAEAADRRVDLEPLGGPTLRRQQAVVAGPRVRALGEVAPVLGEESPVAPLGERVRGGVGCLERGEDFLEGAVEGEVAGGLAGGSRGGFGRCGRGRPWLGGRFVGGLVRCGWGLTVGCQSRPGHGRLGVALTRVCQRRRGGVLTRRVRRGGVLTRDCQRRRGARRGGVLTRRVRCDGVLTRRCQRWRAAVQLRDGVSAPRQQQELPDLERARLRGR